MSSEASISRVSRLYSFPLLCRSVSPFCPRVILTALSNLSFRDTNRWADLGGLVLLSSSVCQVEQGVNAARACPGWGMRAARHVVCACLSLWLKRRPVSFGFTDTDCEQRGGCRGLKQALEKRVCLAAGASWFWSEQYPEFSWQHPSFESQPVGASWVLWGNCSVGPSELAAGSGRSTCPLVLSVQGGRAVL